MIVSLFEHLSDKSETVRHTLTMTIFEMSTHQPELVVSGICAFIGKRGEKMDYNHRVALLQILVKVLEDSRDRIASDMGIEVIRFAAREMVMSQEVKTDWQAPASTVLSLLSRLHPDEVIDELLNVFKPGVEPHYYVVKTIADVASANSVRFTLRLREIINRIIPVLGLVKKPPMKWVFSTALGRIAEAINFFEINADAASKSQVQPAMFESDMTSAWDVIFSKWLEGAENKVRFAVLESLGYLSSVISHKDLESRVNKLATTYLMSMKREKLSDLLPVLQGFCSFLAKVVTDPVHFEAPPQLLLGQVFAGLHDLVCITQQETSMTNPQVLRASAEVLRCFEILCRALPEQTLTFVVNRFQVKMTAPRVGSLVIIRHFVNSLDSVLADRKSIIMSSVTTLVSEPDPHLRRAIIQVVASMATQNYLVLDGGETLVRFIVEQCAVKTTNVAPEVGAVLNQVKRAAEHMLVRLSTRVPTAVPVLWPYLLELVQERSLTGAAAPLFSAIYDIAKAKKEAGDPSWVVDFNRHVNIPSQQIILSRLCILASVPYRQKGLGTAVCGAMLMLGRSIHPAIGEYWEQTVPSLLDYLERNPEQGFNLAKWQDTLLKVWRETLNVINNEQWMSELAGVMGLQFKHYPADPELQRIIQRYMGAVISKSMNKQLIGTQLDLMLSSVNHENEAEQRGCAQGVGMAANPHLDTVLTKLTELLTKTPEHKKSGGFFSFGKKETGPDDPVKATVMLGYGYVVAYSNLDNMLSRIDVHVLHNIIPLLGLDPKTRTKILPILRVQITKAIELIAKAVNSSRLPDTQKHFVLKKRDDLANGLLLMLDEKITGDRTPAELRLLVLQTLSVLAVLEPKFSTKMLENIFDTLVPMYSVITSSVGGDAPSSSSSSSSTSTSTSSASPASPSIKPRSNSQVESKGESPASPTSPSGHRGSISGGAPGAGAGGDDEKADPNEALANAMNQLIQAIIQNDPSVDCLLFIIQRLETIVANAKAAVRNRALQSMLVALKKFVPKISQEKVPQKAKCFPEIGKHIAAVAARVNDGVESTRQLAAEYIQAVLYLDQLLNNADDVRPKPEIKSVTEIKNNLEGGTPESRVKIAQDLVALLCAVMTPGEIVAMARAVIPKLTDPCHSGSLGVAGIFEKAVMLQGSDFKVELKETFNSLLETVKKITKPDVKEAALQGFCRLTRSHFDNVMGLLLKSSTPLPSEVTDAIVAISNPADDTLANDVLQHLVSVLNDTPLDSKAPTPVVMAATCALNVVFEREGIKSLLEAKFSTVLASLLMRTGTAQGVDQTNLSSKQAISALKAFFSATEVKDALSVGDEKACWTGLDSSNYDDSINVITKAVVEARPEARRPLLDFISHFYSQQAFVGQRVVATTMMAEFVSHSAEDLSMQSELIKFLLPCVADKVSKVRKQALRGMGNLVSVWNTNVADQAAAVISSLTGATEDAESDVAAEAVSALTRVAAVVDGSIIGPMLMSICFRMRPAFDRKQVKVRAAAFTLFAELCRFAVRESDEGKYDSSAAQNSNFLDQVHTCVPIFLMHIADEESSVRAAAYEGYKKVTVLLHPSLEEYMKENPDEPSDFDGFYVEQAKLFAQYHGDRLRGYLDSLGTYLSSSWTAIRHSASYASCALLHYASAESRRKLNMHALTVALLKMLDNDDESIRNRTARGMAMLHDI